jgi:hypothetical protein
MMNGIHDENHLRIVTNGLTMNGAKVLINGTPVHRLTEMQIIMGVDLVTSVTMSFLVETVEADIDVHLMMIETKDA